MKLKKKFHRVIEIHPRIESGIPITRMATNIRHVYPWKEMKIGDSFFCNMSSRFMGSIVWLAGKTHGYRYATRQRPGGVRVWRVA